MVAVGTLEKCLELLGESRFLNRIVMGRKVGSVMFKIGMVTDIIIYNNYLGKIINICISHLSNGLKIILIPSTWTKCLIQKVVMTTIQN